MGLMTRGLALVVAVAACGGDGDGGAGDDGGGGGSVGTGTVSGTIGGRTIVVADAISSTYDDNIGSSILHYGVVLIGEAPALCDLAATSTAPGDAAILSLTATVLSTSGGNYVGDLPTVGTYVVNGQIGNVAFGELPSAGCDAPDIMAQTGTVTLTTASNGVYAGSFDIVFETGDHVTGTFAPALCTALTNPGLVCTP